MGINSFLAVLFLGTVGFVFYDIEALKDDIQTQEKPMVSFYDSTTYNIGQQGVSSIAKSTEAYLYKSREEMVDATLLSRDKENTNVDFLKSDFAIKIGNNFYFDGNVFLQSNDGMVLTSEQLEYNSLDKIVQNNLPFDMEYNNNLYHGENLFYDSISKYLKADNIKFFIKDNTNND
jgi:hypothetical protein